MNKADQPAFPALDNNNVNGIMVLELRYHGLTKREYYSAMAMQGLITNNFSPNGFQNGDETSLAIVAVKCADALLVTLSKQTPKE